MNSTERVTNMLLGKPYDRQPIYGWLIENLEAPIRERYGSLDAFEQKYEFDLVHLFSGPQPFDKEKLEALRSSAEEFTPDILLDHPEVWTDPETADYSRVRADVAFYKAQHERFCYIQTPGILEQFNDVFGIQNHLMYLILYKDELMEIYERQTRWAVSYVKHCAACGVDMIHISDDWGSQKDLLISPKMWREMIFPFIKRIVDAAHEAGCFCSLHSDGCIARVLDGVEELGFDLVHPWQENANMPYDLYFEKYQDKFAILGGINIQNALGILGREELEAEIRRVFGLLRGKRWAVCTTHFVQAHCSMDDLEFAYDLIYRLARE